MSLNPKISDWRDKVVWVSGASSGIGAALVHTLLQSGAKVALSARKQAALDTVANGHENAFVVTCDTTDAASVQAAADAIAAHFGRLDLVIVNAGNHTPMRAFELDTAKARSLIDTNLTGSVNTVAAALTRLDKHGGIAIVGSVAGFGGLPTGLIYGATKAALINFAETLYLDLVPRGQSVYLINPGFVKTPLTDKNPFKMPALISAQQAADDIVAGIEAGKFEIDFPRRFTGVVKLINWLPYRWYFWLVHKGTGL
jgi:NAD(P)-dependent dehydrogenase (short-subunit alcohol dehydrogenase family)